LRANAIRNNPSFVAVGLKPPKIQRSGVARRISFQLVAAKAGNRYERDQVRKLQIANVLRCDKQDAYPTFKPGGLALTRFNVLRKSGEEPITKVKWE